MKKNTKLVSMICITIVFALICQISIVFADQVLPSQEEKQFFLDFSHVNDTIVKGKISKIEKIQNHIEYESNMTESGNYYEITVDISSVLKTSLDEKISKITFLEPINIQRNISSADWILACRISGDNVPHFLGESGFKELYNSGNEAIFFLKTRTDKNSNIIIHTGYSTITFSNNEETCTFTDIYQAAVNREFQFPANDLDKYFDFDKSNTDIPPEWLHGKMYTLNEMGVFKGYSNGILKPNDFITREELLTILSRIFRFVDSSAQCTFSDVSLDDWYYTYVASAQKVGLLNGIGENKFGSGEYITRQDFAALTARFMEKYDSMQLPGIQDARNITEIFSDNEEIDDYAVSAISVLVSNKTITGYETVDGGLEFRPANFISRAEVCQIIYPIWGEMVMNKKYSY